jgi:hypothetical protein
METECIEKKTVIINIIVRSDMSLPLVCSGSQNDIDPMESEHVAG